MLIPPSIRDCVAFVEFYHKNEGQYRRGGTVFFVSVPLEESSSVVAHYAVTARHVVDGVKKWSNDNKLRLSVNVRNKSPVPIETDCSDWRSMPLDETIDVAVRPIDVAEIPNDFDHQFLSSNAFVTIDDAKKQEIDLGSEIVITGLFVSHPGTKRNTPIIRFGNIAAMPGEKVETNWHNRNIDAYLIESRSISGLSGSPVFALVEKNSASQVMLDPLSGNLVSSPPLSSTHAAPATSFGVPYHFQQPLIRPSLPLDRRLFLIGSIHGHFGLPCFEYDSGAKKQPSINMGIAMVVPSDNILKVLNQPDLIAARKVLSTKHRKSSGAVLDNPVFRK